MGKAAGNKAMTKTELFNKIGEATGLTRKQVAAVFDSLSAIISEELNKGKKTDPKQFTIPGLCKVVTKFKPAEKERPGTNPFTGEPTMIKAKPARQQIKIRPLKNLKDMVS